MPNQYVIDLVAMSAESILAESKVSEISRDKSKFVWVFGFCVNYPAGAVGQVVAPRQWEAR